MNTWFVCRHPGAIEWMKKQPIHIDRWVTHLDPTEVAQGDTVIGILPMDLAAAICRKEAKFYALTFRTPENRRGTEIDRQGLDELGCRLTRYIIAEGESL